MTVSVEEIARYMRMGRARPDGPLLERIVAIREKSLGVIHPAAVWRRPICASVASSKDCTPREMRLTPPAAKVSNRRGVTSSG